MLVGAFWSSLSSENCRQAVLLSALGSKEKQPDRIPCCNGCHRHELPPELDIVHQIDSTSRRRSQPFPKQVHVELHEALLVARQQDVDMSLGLQMLGPEVVCRNIGHIETVEHMKAVKGLQQDLYKYFFHVILEIVPLSYRR